MRELFEYDSVYHDSGCVAGLDEAGRGPLAGPVVAAAVVLGHGVYIEGVNDSKKLSEPRRRALFFEIVCRAKDIGVGIVDVADIDRVNILNATKTAMKKAVLQLNHPPDILLIDAVKLPDIDIKQVSIIKGDSKSASIAAASIVAKVLRDSFMLAYHQQYPQYGFNKHKGYGTKHHIEMIRAHGPCPIHRRSFAPVSSYT
ncbi:ribonuclease HII [Candidatus Magnetobacterium bavaricum]|uniref:Ribonuclease HII n=1 Tax=Candidatus Magnetobacterium bavaricum TaxID=29290 RepID=A0A0F3GSC7_9BACT|nr:ribonuclease HII [Candidatus Magnetobacterium bavaricum]